MTKKCRKLISSKAAPPATPRDLFRYHKLTPLAAAVLAALYPVSPVLAQDDLEIDETLDNIIVTATKREIYLQDVPHSIDVLTGKFPAFVDSFQKRSCLYAR